MECTNSLGVYTQILERLVTDIAVEFVAHDSSTHIRCLKKLRKRLSSEGFSFLTKTLPLFGKAFDRALSGETPFTPPGWKNQPGRATPHFLWWLLERVFDERGYVRSDACVNSIRHVRQITQLVYKLELPSDEKEDNKVLNSFVAVQGELKRLTLDPRDAVIRRARALVTSVLAGSSSREIVPQHGPGAVSTGERGGEKTHFSRLYLDMEHWYPFTEYFHVSCSHTCERLESLQQLEVQETGTAKVVLVPKDSRGPRLISCEPLEKQWIQQGQRKALYRHIESHPWTRGHVNFTDQNVNRDLALRSSKDQTKVTLDMKEASDRVSYQLVESLFCGTEWFHALEASRSGYTVLPDGTRVMLESFAPMGSAICFPVEALVFWSLCVASLIVHKRVRRRDACESIYVYGDDIICDWEDYPIVMQTLERYGLMFNRSKCCVSGFFRESCGCEAYKGIDITPIRLRKTWSHRASWDATQLQSYVEFSNSMYRRGYSRVASYVEELVRGLYRDPIPVLWYRSPSEIIADFDPCKGPRDPLFSFRYKSPSTKDGQTPPGRVIGFDRPDVDPILVNRQLGVPIRKNKHTQVLEVQGYAIVPRRETWEEDGWERLLRTLVCGPTGSKAGVYTVPRRSRIKRTWGEVK